MDDATNREEYDEKPVKTGYDGREYYQKSLSKLLEGMMQSSIDMNYTLWIRQIRNAVNLVGPFIGTQKSALKKEIDDIIKIYNKLLSLKPGTKVYTVYRGKLENTLFETNGNLITASKHLLLPTSDDDETGEMDMMDLLSESG